MRYGQVLLNMAFPEENELRRQAKLHIGLSLVAFGCNIRRMMNLPMEHLDNNLLVSQLKKLAEDPTW